MITGVTLLTLLAIGAPVAFAIALGVILLSLAFAANLTLYHIGRKGRSNE